MSSFLVFDAQPAALVDPLLVGVWPGSPIGVDLLADWLARPIGSRLSRSRSLAIGLPDGVLLGTPANIIGHVSPF
jgi:hypothetical protein